MRADEEPAVKVTLTTIFDKLLDLEIVLNPIPARVDDHETRMRVLEKGFWKMVGFFSAGQIVIGVLEGLYYTSHLTK